VKSPYQDKLLGLLRDPRWLTLFFVVAAGVLSVAYFGEVLLPFVIAAVIAYFLDGGVRRLGEIWPKKRLYTCLAVYVVFILFYLVLVIGPLNIALRQMLQLARNFPEISQKFRQLSQDSIEALATVIPMDQQKQIANLLSSQFHENAQLLLEKAAGSLNQVGAWLIYLGLVPVLVFFLLKDKEGLQKSVLRLLPPERELVERVWWETEAKIANYIRGKVWEVLMVAAVSWSVFAFLGFRYAAIMGLVSGISVIVPFVGVIGAALPLFLLGYVQWGGGWELGQLMISYGVIQLVDAYVVVPLMFSEAVQLHPIFILMAVLVFGSLWGVWGVFFAIPLATLGKSLLVTLLDDLESAQKPG